MINQPWLLLVNKKNGFTLIELIVVIMMLSILAVTVVPKFLSSKGFEEYTYRDELITKLRAIQLRTMQQTKGSKCQVIQVNSSFIGLLATTPNASTCETNQLGESTSVTISNNHSVSFTISDGLSSFSFTSLGRPEATGCGNSTIPCEITVTVVGENSLAIKINREGYIYAS